MAQRGETVWINEFVCQSVCSCVFALDLRLDDVCVCGAQTSLDVVRGDMCVCTLCAHMCMCVPDKESM